jgi:signal transduction histidine kinase/ligand-binding sensor domain-containing protein
MLTTSDDDAEIPEPMRARASGHILKSMPKSEMLKIIRAAHSGGRHVSPEAAARLAEHPREERTHTNQDAAWPASPGSLLLVLALLLLLAPSPAAAVDPERHISQYGHTAWKIYDGAIPNFNEITQTTDGYIWLGTQDGLMRFDGVRFSLWRSVDGKPLIKVFTALLGANDGSLWIGSLDGLMRLKNGRLYRYTKPSERAPVSTIVQDRAGTIWVGRHHAPKGSGSLCRAEESELVCYGAKDGILAQFAVNLTQDSDGYFWVGGDILCRWRPGSAATCFDEVGRQGGTRKFISALAGGPSGSVWASIDSVGPQFGVRYFSGGKWSPFIVPGFDGPSIRSHKLYLDRHNSLWIGTENNGLYRIHDGAVDHYGSPDGLSSNSIDGFYEDREGNFWVATDGGLDMFRDTPVVSYSMAQGLFASTISSILARRDGSIWIGNEGAIDILRNGEHSLLSLRDLPGDSVGPLFEDHAQTVWLGLDLALLAYRDGRFVEVMQPAGIPLWPNQLLAITEDTGGNIWALGRSGHLFRIQNQKAVEDIQLGQSLSSACCLEPDNNGGVWIASKGKIARYHAGQLETYPLEDDNGPLFVHEMIADADNSLLISTNRGLVRWSNGQHAALGMRNGLPCESIYSTIKDDNGSLWLYARCGLLQIEASQVAKWEGSPSSPIISRVLDAHDGAFPGIQEPRQHISSKAPDGRLWFTNGALVQVVDPKRLGRNEVIPPVAIEDLIADRKALGAQAGMRIPALTRDLQIDYTALSFSVPQKVRFRYILEGHDTIWQEPGERRQAYYTDLTPGNYRFHVIACNNDGVWNEAGASLDFSIVPAWYQTIWFRIFCVTIFGVSLWALYRLRLRQMAYQFNMRLEERVSERSRIARDLHDTLLQTFHGLLLRFQTVSQLLPARPEEAKQRLDLAIEQAAEAITEGRDAVQGLRSSTVETNDLAVAIRTIGEELAADETNQSAAVFQVEVEGTPRNLHPILRDEVYRLAGEALRNAFWHAQARRIEVEIRYDRRQFRLRVRDDGKGIDPKVLGGEGREGHYGLHGMRERAKLVGGKVAVWSERDSGTEVELSIPASTAYATATRRRSWLAEKLSGKGTDAKETELKS